MKDFRFDVCVVGGCGHVGLPLAITFAHKGLKVSIYDINERAIETVRAGRMPFLESGAEPILKQVIGRSLDVANDPGLVSQSRFVVVVIGTPVDEHLNPTFAGIQRALDGCIDHLRDGQVLILRSTVFPVISRHIQE